MNKFLIFLKIYTEYKIFFRSILFAKGRIIMKYSQYSRKRSGNSVYYIIIAVSLVLVGVAAWFAVSRITPKNKVERETSSFESRVESKVEEYSSDLDSYIESEPTYPPEDHHDQNTTQSERPTDQTASAEAQKIKAYTMPVNGEILKDFSAETLQYSATYNDMRIHAAVDIATSEGTLVGACSDGIVKEIENSAEYGKTVTIDHGDGLVIKYCGLKNITAKKDTSVRMGDTIGAVSTVPNECTDQSHIHLEAYKDGKPISILSLFS
jgi:murein DD-endopeptidase MepM/ murein hydrolase activator NlpD